jgi:hypothetical protein
MNKLTSTAIEAIKKATEPIKLLDYKGWAMDGMKEALTNPTIYQSAGLMSVEECFQFITWSNSLTAWDDYRSKSTTELLTIFRQQKEVK